MPTPVSPQQEAKYLEGISRTEEFFMGRGRVRRAHDEIVERLRDAEIPYAIIGAIALNEYGYERATKDVDVLLTREGLEEFKKRWLGRGYLERFPGSRGMRDTRNGVDIDIVIAGDYPGDGKPKSVRFPDPQIAARPGPRGNLLPLETAIELKLASGMSAPHRLRDLADVLELIRICNLPIDFAERLDESVRVKFNELWDAAQHAPDE
jgi:hypothetical protein